MNQVPTLAEVMRKLCANEDNPITTALVLFGAVVESRLNEKEITNCDELAARALTKAGSFETALTAVTATLVGLSRIADREVAEASEQDEH